MSHPVYGTHFGAQNERGPCGESSFWSQSGGSTDPLVLYEDNHVIAVYKRSGQLTQEKSKGGESLRTETQGYLKAKYQKPGNVFLGLVHRLDAPVSGVVVFARTSKGAGRLSQQIREHQFKKTYEAWVEGKLVQGRQLVSELSYGKDGKAIVTKRPTAQSKKAALSFEVVEYVGSFSKLRINLESGRKHQIRAQLSEIGHPILGDSRYGAVTKWSYGGIALVAMAVEFLHPTQEKIIRIEIPSRMNPLLGVL